MQKFSLKEHWIDQSVAHKTVISAWKAAAEVDATVAVTYIVYAK